MIQKLADSGITSIEELADTPIAELTNIKGVGPKSAEKIIASVKDFYLQASESAEAGAASAEAVTSQRRNLLLLKLWRMKEYRTVWLRVKKLINRVNSPLLGPRKSLQKSRKRRINV